MTQSNVTRKGADLAIDAIGAAENAAEELEHQVRDASHAAVEKVEQVSEEVSATASATLENVEQYIKNKPLKAAGIAFAAGILTAIVLRK